MAGNFAFLEKDFPNLAHTGGLAEQYCYSDPNSCLYKLGVLGESIVNLIFSYDKLTPPPDNNAALKINMLLREELIDSRLCELLHALRKMRNKAVHEDYASVEIAQKLLEAAHSLCEWFMQTYGDWTYEHHKFVLPQKLARTPEPPPVEDKAEEERLAREAEAKASAATPVPAAERKKQARKAASSRYISEAETRILIDEQLQSVGWEADTEKLRYSKGTRPQKGHNMAIAEWPTDSGTGNKGLADYALFIDLKMVGIIEAKAMHKNVYSVLDYQGKDYPRNIRKEDEVYVLGTWGPYKVPFTFATNGRPYLKQLELESGVWFLDLRQPDNKPRALRGWMSPLGLQELLEKDVQAGSDSLRKEAYDLLLDEDGLNLRPYQLKAIQAAENAVLQGKDRILLAMATGTGKTRTILGLIYRLLKTKRFRRILFLVDRTTLGEQAEGVFREVNLESLLTLNKIYNIKGLDDKYFEKETRLQIATVQGMVKRILYNESEPMPAVTDYDLLIVDEAHRGYIFDKEMSADELLYRDQLDYQSKYRAVLEYFDAVKIGLTATPALQTTEIFGEPVFKYSYREAVIEGYLVDHDAPHELHTKLSSEGIHYKKGDKVARYNPLTGEVLNSELLEDELDFDVEQFNRQVITENFNRVVLEEIAANLDPENPEEKGKTLIYAVNDAHADLIVKILREIYEPTGVDNDAIMKITGKAGGGNKDKVQQMIKRFKNERYPSIVVTVDLLTTGIDVPEITTLVFLRRVKSRILFEQMLGRATRLCPKIKKTHFEIYDPVGVYDALAEVNTMKPVVASVATSYAQLLQGLETMENEASVQCQVDQIIAKLQRQKYKLSQDTQEQFRELSGGLDVAQFISRLQEQPPTVAKSTLLSHKELFELLQQYKGQGISYIYIDDSEDQLLYHGRGYGRGQRPEDYLEAFANYIQQHRNEIAALNIICTRPRDLTREALKSLRLTLDREGYTTQKLNTALREVTNEEQTADIISLIRRYALGSVLLSHEERIHQAVAKLQKAHKFTQQELSWLKRIEQYLQQEYVLNVQVFDDDGRFKEKGGFARINKAFKNQLENIVLELNTYLYDDGGQSA